MNENTTIENNSDLIERLSEALIFSLQVPNGIQLVAILGTGAEKDNTEALRVWVKQNMADLDHLPGQEILNQLQSRLSNHLDEVRYF